MNFTDNFLYHIYPKKMQGNILLPLNRLKLMQPQLFDEYLESYRDRKHVVNRKIPILDCLWNDVIHTTNIHPRCFFKALSEAGRNPIPEITWLKIPLQIALANPCVVYSCRATIENRNEIPENEVSLFEMSKFKAGVVDQRTLQYYQERVQRNEKLLLFQGIAHFLILGEIDISLCETINWTEE